MTLLGPIDLHFRGRREAIGVYVVDTDSGPALFDTGPTSTLSALEAGLAEHGTSLGELGHVLLSHVHLDHAGAVEAIRARRPERLAVTHFGVYADVDAHLERLDHELDVWASRVRDGLNETAFVEAARVDAADRVDDYDAVAPFASSWHGLRRYWDR